MPITESKIEQQGCRPGEEAGSEPVPRRRGQSLPEISEHSAPKISVIIVSYNVRNYLQQTLNSLQRALRPFPYEIIVVDNASDDGSAAYVRARFPEVRLIANSVNVGFARGNNQALQQASGDYLVLINPDTIAQEDTFVRLVEFMQANPDAGMVGCKILNPDGSLQLACRRSFPTPWVAFTRLTGLSYLFPKTRLFGRYNLTYLPEDQIHTVDAISGSFMMLRRDVFEQVGLLDERFFLYGEDLDWCWRVIQAGWKIYYVPTTQIVHFKGESSRQAPLDRMLDFNRAMALFVKKHFRQRYFFLTYSMLHMAIFARTLLGYFQRTLLRLMPALVDLSLLQLSLAAAIYAKFGHLQYWHNYLPVNAVYTGVWLLALWLCGSYTRWPFSTYRAVLAALSGFIFNSALTYFFKQYAFSRAVVLISGTLNVLLLGGWRFAAKLLDYLGVWPSRKAFSSPLLPRRTLLVGDFGQGEQVLERFKLRIRDGYDIVGLVSLNPDDVGQVYNGWRVIASTAEIQQAIYDKNVHEVIFSTHRIPYDLVLKIIAENRARRVNFKLIPSSLDVIIGRASIDELSEIPLLAIDYRLAHAAYRMQKRAFDFLLAGVTLLIGMPIFAVRSALTWRHFVRRQMTLPTSPPERLVVYENVRMGRLGRLLWLWPVLVGKLSIVGRELLPEDADDSTATFLKPGLTGLVQVNRHRQLTREEREKLRLFYLTNYTPMLDFEIVIKTMFHV